MSASDMNMTYLCVMREAKILALRICSYNDSDSTVEALKLSVLTEYHNIVSSLHRFKNLKSMVLSSHTSLALC